MKTERVELNAIAVDLMQRSQTLMRDLIGLEAERAADH